MFRLIVTIATYNRDRFSIVQNEFTFDTPDLRDAAATHYTSEAFRKNVEAAGAFVKVDAYKV